MIDPILGIDLGTTNSVVAVADARGQVRVLADSHGARVHPSVVSFHPNGSVIVGAEARKRRVIDGPNTVYSAKRLIGQTFDHAAITTATARLPYRLRRGANHQPVVVTRAGEFAIPEISAIVLDHLRTLAGRALDMNVDRAVITVPANFTDAQRAATATAGAIAGITVARVLNEPTAAALAYGHRRALEQVVAVYDFGGGTFDISIVRLDRDVYEVLGTAGDSYLGGDDIDALIVDTMVEHFLREERIDLRGDAMAMQRLREAAEQLKVDLSDDNWATVQVDEIAHGPGGAAIDFHFDMTQDDLGAHAVDIVNQTFPVCRDAIRLAGLRVEDIDDVVLVGGSTKMPYVRERVAEFFGKAPRVDVNPDEAVAMGAALQGLALRRILGPSPTASPAQSVATALIERDAQREKSTDVYPVVGGQSASPALVERAAPLGRIEIARVPADHGPGGHMTRGAQGAARVASVAGEEEETFVPAAFVEPDVITGISRASGEIKLPEAASASALGRPIEPEVVADTPWTEDGNDAAQLETGNLDSLFDNVDTQMPTIVHQSAGADIDIDLSPLDLGAPAASGQFGAEDAATTTRLPMQHAEPAMPAMPVAPAMPAGPAAPAIPAVIDVTPYSLGIGTVAGYCEELIRRNARVPTQIKRIFSTSKDRQETVRIRICQGESRRIDENTILGDLLLEGLQPRPRGDTEIEVTFHIDASGILRVRARDCKTGLEQQASLNILGTPSSEEVHAAAQRLRRIRG